jgi:ribosomal protein L37AE/L43A
MSDEEARATFQRIPWADNDGEPCCPRCGCLKVKALATRPVWKCSGCAYQFSDTAGTIFADRKRPIRDYLLAIAIFVNGVKGHSALQLSRDLESQLPPFAGSAGERGGIADRWIGRDQLLAPAIPFGEARRLRHLAAQPFGRDAGDHQRARWPVDAVRRLGLGRCTSAFFSHY